MRTGSRGRRGRGRVWNARIRQSERPPTLGVQALPSGRRAATSGCGRLTVGARGPVQFPARSSSHSRPRLASGRSPPRIAETNRDRGLGRAAFEWISPQRSLADDAQPRVTSVAIAAQRAPRGGITDLPVGVVVWDDRCWVFGIRRRRPVDYVAFPPPPPDPGNESNGMRCHGRASKSSDPPLKPSNAGLPL